MDIFRLFKKNLLKGGIMLHGVSYLINNPSTIQTKLKDIYFDETKMPIFPPTPPRAQLHPKTPAFHFSFFFFFSTPLAHPNATPFPFFLISLYFEILINKKLLFYNCIYLLYIIFFIRILFYGIIVIKEIDF